MTLVLFKLFTAPVLILVASLVARRFGPAIAGWLVALPLTSGPVAALLAVEHGPRFAQLAAEGSLTGMAAQACYAATYGHLARRGHRWIVCSAAAAVAFVVAGALLIGLHLGIGGGAILAGAALLAALHAIGRPAAPPRDTATPHWDLPLRMAIAGALVASLTTIAEVIGPDRAGLMSTFPVFILVLSAFAHQREGPEAARALVRGLVMGLFGFGAFFVTVAVLATRAETAVVFGVATLANLAVHGVALRLLRRRSAAG
ncbi:MAG: hypothetical protein U1F51_18620 [Burkholderiales bacterium]